MSYMLIYWLSVYVIICHGVICGNFDYWEHVRYVSDELIALLLMRYCL